MGSRPDCRQKQSMTLYAVGTDSLSHTDTKLFFGLLCPKPLLGEGGGRGGVKCGTYILDIIVLPLL